VLDLNDYSQGPHWLSEIRHGSVTDGYRKAGQMIA
jgi:hypothetical protein